MRGAGRVPGLLALLAALAVAAGPLSAQDGGGERDEEGLREALRSHVAFLASDEMRGRAHGSPEGRIASRYVATRFRRIGLEPLGEDGTFFRAVGEGRNVVGRLPGGAPVADETILLGAHHDHLAPGPDGQVHPGADDNASGVACLIEVARTLSRREGRLDRSIAFCTFDGEEQGLLGSRAWTDDPPVPLARTVTMINLDMVGRSFMNALPVLFAVGTESGEGLEAAVREASQGSGYRLLLFGSALLEELWTRSDHAPFDEAGVPHLFLSSGPHPDYHRPTDEPGRVDLRKVARVHGVVVDLIDRLASADAPPEPVEDPPLVTEADRASIGQLLDLGRVMGPGLGLSPGDLEELEAVRDELADPERIRSADELEETLAPVRALLRRVMEEGRSR